MMARTDQGARGRRGFTLLELMLAVLVGSIVIMGVFTIYDWGNGAAAEAFNRLLDHFGSELALSTQ